MNFIWAFRCFTFFSESYSFLQNTKPNLLRFCLELWGGSCIFTLSYKIVPLVIGTRRSCTFTTRSVLTVRIRSGKVVLLMNLLNGWWFELQESLGLSIRYVIHVTRSCEERSNRSRIRWRIQERDLVRKETLRSGRPSYVRRFGNAKRGSRRRENQLWLPGGRAGRCRSWWQWWQRGARCWRRGVGGRHLI